MAINISAPAIINNIMTTQLDLEELKLNIDDMFLVINGIIISCEYIHKFIKLNNYNDIILIIIFIKRKNSLNYLSSYLYYLYVFFFLILSIINIKNESIKINLYTLICL